MDQKCDKISFMQEAFRRAAEKAARNAEALEMVVEIATSMSRVAREELARIAIQKRREELSRLGQGYEDVGRRWETLRLLMPAEMHWGRFRVTEEMVRDQWTDLHRQSGQLDLTIQERVETLEYLTRGMGLTKQLEGLYRLYYVNVVTSDLMIYQMRALLGEAPKYSPAAEVLIFAICDLANLDSNQQRSLYGHMYAQSPNQGLHLLGARPILSKFLATL